MLNRNRSIFHALIPLFLAFLTIIGCAVQQKPQGGPRDTTAPKLLKSTPENETRNFRSKKILLEFDEYFKLNNQYQEISISPAQERAPEFTIKQKTLQIELKDTLQENTTYVINFGKAIVDVNEGNQVKNLTYVFATGPKIDSLSISGSVTNALTHEKEKDVTVLLFNLKQDSLLFGKKKPSLFTTTDSTGNFKFSNLKPDEYRIYALKETAPDKIYNNDNELIAYKADPIKLTKDTSDVNLTLFRQIPEVLRFPNRIFDRDGSMFISTNRQLTKPSVKIISSDALDAQKIVEVNKTRDSIYIYSKNMDFDSVKVAVYEDGKALDTLTFRKARRENFQRNIALSYNINQGNHIKPGTDLMITSNIPIESYDQQQIILMKDSARVNYTLRRDTATRKRLLLKYNWEPKAKYTLIFNENSITNVFGDKIKKTQKIFEMDEIENYGKFTIRISVPDTSSNYIIDLIDANAEGTTVRTERIRRNTTIIYQMLHTGKYQIRVTYDTNKNGKWDAGNLRLKTQPENIWVNPSVYNLRANWEMTEDMTIPKEPPPNP